MNTEFNAASVATCRSNAPVYHFTHVQAAQLVGELFSEVGMQTLRGHRDFEYTDFYSVDQLTDHDLCKAICLGLEMLQTNRPDVLAPYSFANETACANHSILTAYLIDVLGDITKPTFFYVGGYAGVWNPDIPAV